MIGNASFSFGDYLRACRELRPDDATRLAIARLLGITAPEPPRPAAGEEEGTAEVASEPSEEIGEPPSGLTDELGGAHPPRLGTESPGRTEISSVLVPDRSVVRHVPAWLEGTWRFPESDRTAASAVSEPDPLLVRHWTRALLSDALSTLSEAGPLDIERLVRGVARNIPWGSVPRLPWPTLARGVRVLVDKSEAMLPFAADQEQLLRHLRLVVGEDKLQILRFEAHPSRGAGTGTRRTWKGYFELPPPPRGTAVLALTDLGIGAPGYGFRAAGVSEWRDFATRLHQSNCPLVVLTPYGPDRWPAELVRSFPILHWDPATSVRTVRRVIGKALRVPGGPRQ